MSGNTETPKIDRNRNIPEELGTVISYITYCSRKLWKQMATQRKYSKSIDLD